MLARKEPSEVGGSEGPCTPLVLHTGPDRQSIGLPCRDMGTVVSMHLGPSPMPFPNARCPFDPDECTQRRRRPAGRRRGRRWGRGDAPAAHDAAHVSAAVRTHAQHPRDWWHEVSVVHWTLPLGNVPVCSS